MVNSPLKKMLLPQQRKLVRTFKSQQQLRSVESRSQPPKAATEIDFYYPEGLIKGFTVSGFLFQMFL